MLSLFNCSMSDFLDGLGLVCVIGTACAAIIALGLAFTLFAQWLGKKL